MTLVTLHDTFSRNIPFYSHARRFYREECVTMRHASLGWHLGIVCGEQNGIILGELPVRGFVGGGRRGLSRRFMDATP